jgi:hypothetical protein
MVQMAALLPIAPILLLPFILIFFVVVFPIWLVALIILAPIRWIAVKTAPNARVTRAVDRAFQWVVTFGGLIDREKKAP